MLHRRMRCLCANSSLRPGAVCWSNLITKSMSSLMDVSQRKKGSVTSFEILNMFSFVTGVVCMRYFVVYFNSSNLQ